jgi:hypothetical protein
MLEELNKAIAEAAAAGVEMLRKGQLSLFGTGTTNLSTDEIHSAHKEGLFTDAEAHQMHGEAHHKEYTRTSASGTVSEIKAKGTPSVEIKRVSSGEENVSQRHVTYDVHVDGKYHSTHPDVVAAMDLKEQMEKPSSTADELTRKADTSNTSQDHETARIAHLQAAGKHPKRSAQEVYHMRMATYHSARP